MYIPFLIIHLATYIIHQKESLHFRLDMLNMQNPLLFALFFLK